MRPALIKERPMPMGPYLDGYKFDPETKRVMGVAFEMTRATLRLHLDDPATETVAKKIIELAEAGERDANQLCKLALKDFRGEHERGAVKPGGNLPSDARATSRG